MAASLPGAVLRAVKQHRDAMKRDTWEVGSIGSIIHCDCNYLPGILRLGEMHDIAGLVAPRHFLAVAGRDDPIFPVAHTRAAFKHLAMIYGTAGVPARCELYIGDGGH